MTSTIATAASARPDDELDRERLRDALEHARHYLPTQGPIRTFVHHNTLHAFEHLPFDEAVVRAAERFGAEPYPGEETFAEHLASGRIGRQDIAAVLADEELSEQRVMPGGPTLRSLRALRLEHAIERLEGAALAWRLEDGGALARFDARASERAKERVRASGRRAAARPVDDGEVLAAIYARLAPHAPELPPVTIGPRARDRVLATYAVDVDGWVQPLLVRLVAAFVDQGVAYWRLPERDRGLLGAFRALYARGLGPPDPWLRGLPLRLAAQARAGLDAEWTAVEALLALAIPRARWGRVVEATLRSLAGWAGMIAQLEERPDRAPVEAPPARLMDYLAVALLLESEAVRHVEATRRPVEDGEQEAAARRDESVVHEAFVLAQLAGLGPAELEPPRYARAFVQAVAAFDSFERRRLWHLAYELRHRQQVLDALLAHARLGCPPAPSSPAAQVLFCIDDREESLRRHLEEVEPSIETLGYAGFFGVAMAYRGHREPRATPLCPVVVRPRHLVIEEPVEAAPELRSRSFGAGMHAWEVGSKTLVRGGVLAPAVGLAAVIPLIGRALFPRLTARLSHAARDAAIGAPRTRLSLERAEGDGQPGPDGLFRGFTVSEMTDIVANVLRTCGLGERFAPIVALVGHGSSSLNNPHEAAHDCGATGGGRGGPNARAFAVMANHPAVRARLAERGLSIPASTVFVGAYHNTCDDSVDWFDVDLVPEARADDLERLRAALERARRRDAHERCRHFESASRVHDPEAALAHVEGRANDLGEPRPEYGHATNAVCFVGRRERTRGLFLDRRAFLVSYDPERDPGGEILGGLLAAVVPVGAGISLEYYFSYVDQTAYGCGTKLPHNIVGLVGVMDGHASDLRTGLPWQMVEIHEPVRLLNVIEAEPEVLERLLERSPAIAQVVVNQWVQLVAWSPSNGRMFVWERRGFVPYEPRSESIPIVPRSIDHYGGRSGHLEPARVEAALRTEAS